MHSVQHGDLLRLQRSTGYMPYVPEEEQAWDANPEEAYAGRKYPGTAGIPFMSGVKLVHRCIVCFQGLGNQKNYQKNDARDCQLAY